MHYILVVGEAQPWHLDVVTVRLGREGIEPKVVNVATLDSDRLSSMLFEPAPELSVRGKRNRFVIEASAIYGLVSSQEEWDRASTIFDTCEEIFPALCIWAAIQPDKSLEILHGKL